MKRTSLALAALLLSGTLAGCGAGGTDGSVDLAENGDLVIGSELVADADLIEAAKEEGSLVFYTGASEQSEGQVAEAFTEDTGIDVEIVRLAPNKLSERILSEQAAGELGADLIRTSGEDLISSIADSGALEEHPLTPDITGAIDPAAVYDDGTYYSSFDRIYSFGYNNQVIKEAEAPQNWADLLDEKYKGQNGVVQVGAGGSTAALTRFQFDRLGTDWMEQFAATDPRVFDSSASVTDALARGEIGIASIPIATAYSAMEEGAPITVAIPDEGAAAYPFYLGLAADAEHPNAAKVFMNWLMSASGQELAASIGDYPVHKDMPNPSIGEIELPAADSDFVYRSTIEESLKNLEPDAKQWTQIFGYTG